jgi:hypothetical protein
MCQNQQYSWIKSDHMSKSAIWKDKHPSIYQIGRYKVDSHPSIYRKEQYRWMLSVYLELAVIQDIGFSKEQSIVCRLKDKFLKPLMSIRSLKSNVFNISGK